MTAESYYDFATNIYKLIVDEFKQYEAEKTDLNQVYSKLVIMYEFFRLIRGEAFVSQRPPTPEKQTELYKMEDEIGSKLEEIKTKIDPKNPTLQSSFKDCFSSHYSS